VRHDRRRGDHLGAAQHDAVVALFDHAGVEERLTLLVRGLRTITLWRHHGVRDEEVFVPCARVEAEQVVGELLAAPREDVGRAREPREDRRARVGGASHDAERTLRPRPMNVAAECEIGRGARDEPHGRRAGARRRLDVRRRVGIPPLARQIVHGRDLADRLREGRMTRHVGHSLAVEVHGASVVETLEELSSCSHGKWRL
jgi:hypothetical protein